MTKVVDLKNVIAENLRSKRLSLDMTQEGFADKIGSTQKCVHHYEAGRVYPPLPVLVKISEVTGLPVDWYLTKHEKL